MSVSSIVKIDCMSIKDQQKKKLLNKYYSDLRNINAQRSLDDSDELRQLWRDKLFQIKQLLRYDRVIVYDYEE